MTNETKPSPSQGLILLLACAVAAIGLAVTAPWLIDRGERESEEYQANREKIAGMTEAERERLKRRADRFYNEKTESEREAIRDLHDKLQTEKDAKQLRAVMKQFNEWLTSMTPVAREEFRREMRKRKSVEEKLALVEKTKQQEDDRRFVNSLKGRDLMMVRNEKDPVKRRQMIADLRESMRSGSRSRRWRFDPLSTSELDAIINLFEAEAPLDAMVRERLKKMPPNERRLQVMVLAMQTNREQRRDNKTGWLEDERLRKTVESSDLDPQLKEKLIKSGDSRWNRRYGILGKVTGSLFHERRELRGNPSEAELSAFLESMDPDDRKELMKYRGSEKRYHLKRKYYEGGSDSRAYREFRTEMMRTMFRRRSFGSRKGGRPPSRKPSSGNGRR